MLFMCNYFALFLPEFAFLQPPASVYLFSSRDEKRRLPLKWRFAQI